MVRCLLMCYSATSASNIPMMDRRPYSSSLPIGRVARSSWPPTSPRRPITVNDIVHVVDGGLHKEERYDLKTKVVALSRPERQPRSTRACVCLERGPRSWGLSVLAGGPSRVRWNEEARPGGSVEKGSGVRVAAHGPPPPGFLPGDRVGITSQCDPAPGSRAELRLPVWLCLPPLHAEPG